MRKPSLGEIPFDMTLSQVGFEVCIEDSGISKERNV